MRVPRTQRRALARTAFAGIRRDVDGLVDGFYTLGVAESGADRPTLRRLVETLLEIAYTPQTTALDRMNLLADRVLATMYDFPVTLPSDLVYFARTAALIEGLGTRYDARFNAVTFAAPVALKLRGPIIASLHEPGQPPVEIDWAILVGRAAGEVAKVIEGAAREVVGILGRVVAELATRMPMPAYQTAPSGEARTDGTRTDGTRTVGRARTGAAGDGAGGALPGAARTGAARTGTAALGNGAERKGALPDAVPLRQLPAPAVARDGGERDAD